MDIGIKLYLERIEEINEEKDDLIEKLKLENERLKSGVYENSVVKELEEENNRLRQDNLRGFPITEEQAKAIEEWRIKHESEVHGRKTLEDRLRAGGAIGGKHYYRFFGTGLGTCGEIVCDECGQSFEFQELW